MPHIIRALHFFYMSYRTEWVYMNLVDIAGTKTDTRDL